MNETYQIPPIVRPGTSLRNRETLNSAMTYVERNLSRKIVLREVAAHCGVSVSTLTQLFQKQLGTTFHQYLTARRMEAAKTLIRQGVPLEQVGQQLGYPDHSTFYRAFRQTYGSSPREYRKKLAEE